jgi:hypothetical protein
MTGKYSSPVIEKVEATALRAVNACGGCLTNHAIALVPTGGNGQRCPAFYALVSFSFDKAFNKLKYRFEASSDKNNDENKHRNSHNKTHWLFHVGYEPIPKRVFT